MGLGLGCCCSACCVRQCHLCMLSPPLTSTCKGLRTVFVRAGDCMGKRLTASAVALLERLVGWLAGWLVGWLVGCPLTPGDESTLKRLLTQTLSLQIEQHLQQMVLLFQPRRSCFGCFGPCTCRVVDPANVCEQGTCRAQYPSAAC